MNRIIRIGLVVLLAIAPASTVLAGNWVSAPSLNGAREWFGTTTDECGNIWVVGGWNRTGGCCCGTGPVLNSIETLAFNGQSYAANWQTSGITLPTQRMIHAVAISHGFLYVMGGYDHNPLIVGDIPLTQVDRYDFRTGSWSSSAIPPTRPRQDGAAVVDRLGRIWFIGGQDRADNNLYATDTVDIFDPARPELGWQDGPLLNHRRFRFGCTIDDRGRIWITGGTGANGNHEQTVEYIDPCGSNTWTLNAHNIPNPTTNDDQCTIGADGRIYIVGGYIANTWFNRTLQLRPETGTMVLLNPLIQARSQHRVVLGKDKYIYAIGGNVSGCVSTTNCEKLNTGPSRPEPSIGPEE